MLPKKKRSIDPSRTTLLRRAFESDMKKRFDKVRKATTKLFVVYDVLGTKREKLSLNIDKSTFTFASNPEKVRLFRKWLKEQVDNDILSVSGGIKGKPWTAKYIESAYQKGMLRSYTDTNKKRASEDLSWFGGAREQFLKTAFLQPVTVAQVEMLYTRAFNLLNGVTDEMSNQMSRILADGFANGWSPRKIASEMSKSVQGLTRKRAMLIARTEVIRAHAEGQLDAFEMLGISEVEAEVEFATSKDEKVCPICLDLEGKRYKVKDARGIIPQHPNCRCSWSAIVDERLLKGVRK